MAAVMISTCIQPHLDSNIGLNGYTTLEDSPHHRLRLFIEAAWMFSTIVGVVLFLALIVLACWVKFWDLSPPAAVASVAVIVPVLLIFVGFTILFYYTLAGHKVDQANILVENLSMRMRLLESGEMDPNVSALSTSDKKEAADGSP